MQKTANDSKELLQEINIKDVPQEITEWDLKIFKKLTNTELTNEQEAEILNPRYVFEKQKTVMALHWHPEFVSLDLIKKRIRNTFPNFTNSLIIPTQHNVLVEYDGYTGVEIDCYSKPFKVKVQLLAHFNSKKLKNADTLKSMLEHTFKYRNSQLFEFIDTILNPKYIDRLHKAADGSMASIELIEFLRVQTKKLLTMIKDHEGKVPPEMLRNKILINFFEALKDHYSEELVGQITHYLKAIKREVKRNFSKEYFYETQEIIEEVRSLGGGLVIPHPEQFWPILLADYDVDGYEVWNPQSQKYTEFLINVVIRQNKTTNLKRPLIITMGDDCHMGEKTKDKNKQDPEKVSREIGVQPWDEIEMKRCLDKAGITRDSVIKEYKARLDA